MANSYVLDSSAILALVFEEPGMEKVEELLAASAISIVNVVEAVTRMHRNGIDIQLAWQMIESFGRPFVPFDERVAGSACDLATLSWIHGISLGDRACLATAMALNATAVTCDRSWSALDIKCTILALR